MKSKQKESLNQGHVLSTFIFYPSYSSLFEVTNKGTFLLRFRTNILSYFLISLYWKEQLVMEIKVMLQLMI